MIFRDRAQVIHIYKKYHFFEFIRELGTKKYVKILHNFGKLFEDYILTVFTTWCDDSLMMTISEKLHTTSIKWPQACLIFLLPNSDAYN